MVVTFVARRAALSLHPLDICAQRPCSQIIRAPLLPPSRLFEGYIMDRGALLLLLLLLLQV